MPRGIYERTAEHKRNISKAHKGKKRPPFSEEWRKNLGKVSLKRWQEPGYKEKMSEIQLKRFEDPKEIEKLSKPRSEKVKANMKGKCGVYERTPEHCINISKALLKKYQNPEYQEMMLGALNRPEVKEKHKKAMRIALNRPEVKTAISKRMIKFWQDPGYRKSQVGVHNRPEAKAKHSKAQLKNWQDSEYQKKMIECRTLKPNKLERIFDELTPECVEYVGDWQFFITTKIRTHNPDFKVKGQRKIIELFGDYWHEGENPNKLISEYKSAGWICIIFWEHEVYNDIEKVQKETLEFIGSY